MTPFILIITGVILSFISCIKLFRFSGEVSEKIAEINELFSSDAFLLHKDLREELDELNFSYYEILERQDERISDLEKKISPIEKDDKLLQELAKMSLNSEALSVEVEDKAIRKAEIKEKDLNQKKKQISASENNKNNEINTRVLMMLEDGYSKEEIASELDIGVGMVETICSVYRK